MKHLAQVQNLLFPRPFRNFFFAMLPLFLNFFFKDFNLYPFDFHIPLSLLAKQFAEEKH